MLRLVVAPVNRTVANVQSAPPSTKSNNEHYDPDKITPEQVVLFRQREKRADESWRSRACNAGNRLCEPESRSESFLRGCGVFNENCVQAKREEEVTFSP